MRWKLIEDDRPDYGPYRISTLGYMYSLSARNGIEYWAHHWHPSGNSPVTEPHLHLGDELLSESSPITKKAHLPTSRFTFEAAVRWVIEFGVDPVCEDWDERLTLAETPHVLFRSWTK